MNSWDVMRNNCDAEEETGHDQAQAENRKRCNRKPLNVQTEQEQAHFYILL